MGVLCQRESETAVIDESAVDEPHGSNKTDGTQHSDGWEILHRIHAVLLQDTECCRIGKGDGWHKEGHTQGVECDKGRLVRQFLSETGLHTHPPTAEHESACHQMAQAKQTLRLNILICHYTHQCRHKDTHDALDGVKPGNLVA